MDWLQDIIAQDWFWPLAILVAGYLFRDNPAIKPILDLLKNIVLPKKPAVVDADTSLSAVEHYVALMESCKRCPKAQESLKAVWVHLAPEPDPVK